MSSYYVLDRENHPVALTDVLIWAQWFEQNQARRIVQQDMVGDVRVSTVFLGLDHRFGFGAPVLFETMIFGGAHDDYQERYETYDEAVLGHARALALVT